MGSDVTVDFLAGSGATAVGAMAGSFFLPPLGTVVGTGVGMAINIGLNWEYGNPPTTLVKQAKSIVKSGVKTFGKAVSNVWNWMSGK